MKFFFSGWDTYCKCNVIKSTVEMGLPQGYTWAKDYPDNVGRVNCRENIYNDETDTLMPLNNMVLASGGTATTDRDVLVKTTSADYFPAEILVNGYTESIYWNNIAHSFDAHTYSVIDVKPNPYYGRGNTISLTPFACDCVTCETCNTCEGGSCFLAGTNVLMADGTWKVIEEVNIGEFVHGLDGINEVIGLYTDVVGDYRNVWSFDDLFFTGEHLFWIRKDGKQMFGTHDYTQFLYEQRHHYYNVGEEMQKYIGTTPYIITEPVEFANINGWRWQRGKVRREFGSDTKIYNLVVGGSHTFIANGYVVGGEVRDDDYDYSKSYWD